MHLGVVPLLTTLAVSLGYLSPGLGLLVLGGYSCAFLVAEIRRSREMAKIGALIQSTDDASKTADASREAALAADKKASDDQAAYEATRTKLAAAIKKAGPITVANGDGTFTTYESSTTDPGYRVEVSKGIETEVDDDDNSSSSDANSTPPPTPTPSAPVDPGPAPVVTPTPTPASDVNSPFIPPAQRS